MDTGGRNTPSRFMLQKLEVGTGLQGTLGSNADLTLFYFQSCKCEFLKEQRSTAMFYRFLKDKGKQLEKI